MALVTLNDANLTAIADAIRAKGVEGNFTPSQMAPAIASITGGGNFEPKYYSTTNALTAIMPDDFNEDSIILCGTTTIKWNDYYATVFFGYIPQIIYNLYNVNAVPQFPDPMPFTMQAGIYTSEMGTTKIFNIYQIGTARIDINTPPANNLNFFLRNGIDYDSSTKQLRGLINSGGSAFTPTWTTDSLTNKKLYMVYI